MSEGCRERTRGARDARNALRPLGARRAAERRPRGAHQPDAGRARGARGAGRQVWYAPAAAPTSAWTSIIATHMVACLYKAS